ncbi:MAG: hypothetical protein WC364_10585 [Eubacteriales bacterium]
MAKRPLEKIYFDLLDLAETLNDHMLFMLLGEIKTIISDNDEKNAAKDWKKGSGVLQPDSIRIEVFKNDNHPGVMIHRKVDENGGLIPGWAISHESGYRLGPPTYANKRKAVKAFMNHASKINWNRPRNKLIEDPEAMQANRDLINNA